MLIETLLANYAPPHEITHVFTRNNITFFKLHGESFCCAASHIYHNSSAMFDSAPLKVFAANAHVPENIEENKQMMEDINRQLDLWEKYKAQLYATILPKAVQLFADHGIDRMIDFIDSHFDLAPEKGAHLMMKKWEE
jgi:hypothetical protein